MGVDNFIVQKMEDNREGGVRKGLDEPFLLMVWARRKARIAPAKESVQRGEIKGLRPRKRVVRSAMVGVKDGGHG